MKKILFTAILLLIIVSVNAQQYTDIITVGIQYSPSNELKTGNSKVNIIDQSFGAKAPIKVNKSDYALIGFSENHLAFSGDSLPGGTSFTALTLQLGYIANFGRYNLTTVLLPKISSDFAHLTDRNFQMGGLVVFTVKHSDNFKLKYGCYYNHEFFGPLIVPIIGLDWKVNEKLRIFGNLPITATAEYRISERFSSGIFFNANTTSYLYDKQRQYIHKNTQEISAFGDIYLTKNLVFQAKIGHTIGRKYDLFNLSDKIGAKMIATFGDHRDQLNTNILKDGVIGEVKPIFRVPTN